MAPDRHETIVHPPRIGQKLVSYIQITSCLAEHLAPRSAPGRAARHAPPTFTPPQSYNSGSGAHAPAAGVQGPGGTAPDAARHERKGAWCRGMPQADWTAWRSKG